MTGGYTVSGSIQEFHSYVTDTCVIGLAIVSVSDEDGNKYR